MEAEKGVRPPNRSTSKLIDECMTKGFYHRGIEILEEEIERDDLGTEERCEFLERLAICYHLTSADAHRSKEFRTICECVNLQAGGDCIFKYPFSVIILGQGYLRMGELETALNFYHRALSCDVGPVMRESLVNSVAQIEAAMKDAEASREKMEKELIEDEEKQKREMEAKMLQVKKKKEQKKSKSFKKKENIKKAEEPVCELEIEEYVGAGNLAIPGWQRREFSASFSVLLTKNVGRNCYIGALRIESVELPKSFLEASSCHINQLQRLVSLGRMHESLLNVEHSIVDRTDDKFLVTEVIYPLEEFFLIQYKEFKSSNKDSWWVHISGMFWRIFRDVSRGLMFLYEKTDLACGDLCFNSFVTTEGRGRILPTLEHKSKKGREDVKQLIHLMKSVLYIPSNGIPDTALHLPSDLTKLLDIVPRYLNLPPSFLVDLPILWSDGEKIDFSPKFKKLSKKNFHVQYSIQTGMEQKHIFNKWWKVLNGAYFEIYKRGRGRNHATAPYKKRVDIARFFNASYSHVNDKSYKKYRRGKKWTDDEIERDLISFFPDYYVTVFDCLCYCVNATLLEAKELKNVSSIYFRNDDQ